MFSAFIHDHRELESGVLGQCLQHIGGEPGMPPIGIDEVKRWPVLLYADSQLRQSGKPGSLNQTLSSLISKYLHEAIP